MSLLLFTEKMLLDQKCGFEAGEAGLFSEFSKKFPCH